MTPNDDRNEFLVEDFFLQELDDVALSRLEASIRQQPALADELLSTAKMIESVRAVGLDPIEQQILQRNIRPMATGWRSFAIVAVAAAASILIVTLWSSPATTDSDETLEIAQAWLEQTSLATDDVNQSIAPEVSDWDLDDSESIVSIVDDPSLDWIHVAMQIDAPEATDG